MLHDQCYQPFHSSIDRSSDRCSHSLFVGVPYSMTVQLFSHVHWKHCEMSDVSLIAIKSARH